MDELIKELGKLWYKYIEFMSTWFFIIFFFLLIKFFYNGLSLDSIIILIITILSVLFCEYCKRMLLKIGDLPNVSLGIVQDLFKVILLYILIFKGIYPLIKYWYYFDSNWHKFYRLSVIVAVISLGLSNYKLRKELNGLKTLLKFFKENTEKS